ncbi:MAG TPA: DUF885 domain-containing protein [Bryobacteraceae bacterium]|nr:DUF885 domain-containing protein [Bryobacteraceae bacterium]
MLKGVIGTVTAMSILGGCGAKKQNENFDNLRSDFVYGALALSPVSATMAGYHKHGRLPLDEMMDDYSPMGLRGQHTFYDRMKQRIAALDQQSLRAEDQADLELMNDSAGLGLLELDTIQSYKHNPTLYVELAGNALFNPFVLEYAPKETRYRHIIMRLAKVPNLFDQARANLVDAPEIWNQTAQEENDGTIDLIEHTLKDNAPASLRDDYDRAAKPAVDSLHAFNTWLKTDLAKRTSDWRLGKDKYDQKFRYVLDVGKAPDQVLSDAEAELDRVHGEMAKLAGATPVKAYLDNLAQQHSTPQSYFSDAQKDLDQAISFVKEKNLVPVPNTSNLRVIPTPEFMRGIYGVGGFSPAPALEPQLGAWFWVTPLSADPKRSESKLREYNKYGLQHLVVHEAMPGHYLQFEYANHIEPLSRRVLRSVFGNGPYVEGWAFYTQQLMSEAGYMNNDPGYKMTLYKQCLRVITNAILDIRLQTMGMTDQQAMDLMVDKAYQEHEEAELKLKRAKLSSAQLPMYFVGWRGWLRLREADKSKEDGSFSLPKFHERALKESAVPLPALGRLLGLQ